ncbi:TetR/AcrR family transcriptional regulator [uncultured Ruthenibacterium sp.]|uniref:TetR/AcrR family transcriptional regulator n=1 Tax=uncultured Ruthenibacterium sp. TaxID=1905347 RepID=UPI00349ECD53
MCDYQERRRQQAQKTEQAILEAAMELCRQESFDKVSVRDICKYAGITTGAFYHHFRSKDELLSRGFTSLDVYMEQVLRGHESEPPEQRLRLILFSYASFMEDLGWELVARYYQHRLGQPDFHSIDPRRFTLQALLKCLTDAQSQKLLLTVQTPEWIAQFLLTAAATLFWKN